MTRNASVIEVMGIRSKRTVHMLRCASIPATACEVATTKVVRLLDSELHANGGLRITFRLRLKSELSVIGISNRDISQNEIFPYLQSLKYTGRKLESTHNLAIKDKKINLNILRLYCTSKQLTTELINMATSPFPVPTIHCTTVG